MEVYVVKLLNGEEVLGKLLSGYPFTNGQASITLSDAVTLQMFTDPKSGQPTRGFADWPGAAQPGQDVVLPVSALACMPLKAHEELERQYISAISGMELPPVEKKILLS